MIAITGKNGYLSNNFKEFLQKKGYGVLQLDVKNGINESMFKDIDVLIHTAGIVHKKAKKQLYYSVNYELTCKIAELAKKNGVKHFIFISTMSVYGKITGEINRDTPLNPVNYYGKSKLLAEQAVLEMADDNFLVTVVRPPMVYGKDCSGNYATLKKLVCRIPVFPKVNNKRSMIFVDNLSNCIYNIINNKIIGVLLPQNEEYVNTADMCSIIAECNRKNLHLSRLMVCLTKLPLKQFKKAFGNLYYNKEISYSADICDFKNSIIMTEK